LSFEVTSKDLLGRIGTIDTRSGRIETPHLLPVVNPLIQPISPKDMLKTFRCNAIITNAYLVKKNLADEALSKGIHKVLDYDGIVVTDSGAYQILEYGNIEVQPDEIALFQEAISTDIAVILDVPTGWVTNRARAEWTVNETIRRADLTLKTITRSDILWEGPIQGGTFLDLVAKSAKEMSQRPFAICSLGSPTPIMERYMFDRLVDMIMTAKMNIPPSKPLHLFGAGHPFMLALVTALGCDLFDSASYAIFAEQGRYLTESGTLRLREIVYFPCACPVCQRHTPRDLIELEKADAERKLAEHNLFVCLEEIRRIKQAITEGRLWELVETRARSHPSLLQALGALKKYARFIERHSPSTKKKGLLYLGQYGLSRPEIIRHRMRLIESYRAPKKRRILLLLPQVHRKPYHTSPQLTTLSAILRDRRIHACVYGSPYGVVPLEIDDVYPLSQTESTTLMDPETERFCAKTVREYAAFSNYETIVLHAARDSLSKRLIPALRQLSRKAKRRFTISYRGDSPWSKDAVKALSDATKRLRITSESPCDRKKIKAAELRQ